ncbi:MAG: CocE/NonD family hydrolase [Chloroflexi bacterium]|nr:CocE/NonD family hydrolase [Chloroflexota bacterium]
MTTTTLKTATLHDLHANPPEKRYKKVENRSLYLPMRDGTRIALDVMLPADAPPGTRFPTLMILARYWRSIDLRMPDQPGKPLIGPRERTPDDFIARGFALVVVDARGTGASFGSSRAPFAPEEIADYGEVVAWVLAQLWCSGHIGAYGISYEGATALRLVATGHEGIKGVIPQEIEYDVYADVAMPGGIFNTAFIEAWSMSNAMLDSGKPSKLFPFSARLFSRSVRPVDEDRKTGTLRAQALAEHQANTNVYAAMNGITFRDDPFGDSGLTLDDISVYAYNDEIRRSSVPLFSWGSWLDGAAAEAVLRTFNTFPNPQIAVIGAWKHEMTAHGSPYQKPSAKPDPLQAQQWAAMTAFFQRTLVEDRPPAGKTLTYYTLGEEVWKQTDAFPLPGATQQTWYFAAGNGLTASAPVEQDATDSYTVDFEASTGKTNRWNTQMAQPVHYPDRAKMDQRLLTYTSAPLEHDMEITGYPSVTLHIASSSEDAAFFVYLEDVDERGVVRYLTEGQLRGLHRKLADAPPPYVTGMPYHSCRRADASPLPRGQRVEVVIGLQPTSALIRRGHRIRVAIAGADKDTFARIPESGTPTFQVSRSAAAASHIVLPVVAR